MPDGLHQEFQGGEYPLLDSGSRPRSGGLSGCVGVGGGGADFDEQPLAGQSADADQ